MGTNVLEGFSEFYQSDQYLKDWDECKEGDTKIAFGVKIIQSGGNLKAFDSQVMYFGGKGTAFGNSSVITENNGCINVTKVPSGTKSKIDYNNIIMIISGDE